MEFEFKKGVLKFERELSNLDKLVLKFTHILNKQKIDYVLISGYVAILFGRSRNTEDIDLFIEKMPLQKFLTFWNAVYEDSFECINESNPVDAYNYYLNDGLALRFALKGTFIWNFEVKFPKTKSDFYSLEHKIVVEFNGEQIVTSELELQIAYKLYLGSDKDFEDARHLYNVFKAHLGINLLTRHISEFKMEKQAERILWKKKV